MPDFTNFWLSFAAIASTLSGFTLASYSIYTNRAEVVAADPMCRNYALKEAASRESLKFIFLTLAMFLVPLLVSFGFLITGNALYLVLELAYISILVLLPSGFWALYSTVRYQFRVTLCEDRLRHFGQPRSRMRSLRKAVPLILLLSVPPLVALWGLSLLVVHISSEVSLWGISRFLLPSYGVEERAMLASLLSVAGGILLVYVHFVVFDPRYLLFRVDDGARMSLARMVRDLRSKCEALERSRGMLRNMIVKMSRDSGLRKRIMEEFQLSAVEAQRYLHEAEHFTQGQHRDRGGNDIHLLENKEYHAERLEFWREGDFLSYDQWVRIISDVELYTQGLANFEIGIQERQRDYLGLIRSRGAVSSGLSWENLLNALMAAARSYVARTELRG